MELATEEDFATIRGRPKVPLYEEIVNLPSGSIVRCVPGVDFNGEPQRFRRSVIYAMKQRGVSVKTRIRDGNLLIKVLGNKEEE